jgi:hypothetical protein
MEKIFYPQKARKYPYSCQDSIDTKMTLMLECRLRLRWQAKLALPSLPASQVGLNRMLAGNANSRCCLNQLFPAYFAFLIFFVSFADKYPFLK